MTFTLLQLISFIAVHIARTYAVTNGLPSGNYALPMTKGLCGDDFAKFYHRWDDEDDNNKNQWLSSYNDLLFHNIGKHNTETNYCQRKYSWSPNTLSQWPAGKYCIVKKQGTACPLGFQSGRLYMDTEDDDNNDKKQMPNIYGSSPVVNAPYGGTGAAIDFCCRSDGDVNRPVIVVKTWSNAPKEFALYPKTSTCQKFEGYWSRITWRYQDNEDDDNHNERYTSGSLPYGEFNRNTKIFVCYYYRDPTRPHWIVDGNPGFGVDDQSLVAECKPNNANRHGQWTQDGVTNIGVNCCNDRGEGSRSGCVTGRAFTYAEAHAFCDKKGLRICTRAETNAGAGRQQGCQYDHTMVWTSDFCTLGTVYHQRAASWRKGKAGATCDETCNAIGRRCDSNRQSSIRSCTDIASAAAAAGVSCAHHSSCYGRTDRDRAYAGTPFISQVNGLCYWLSDGAKSVCDGNANTNHEPLCYCV